MVRAADAAASFLLVKMGHVLGLKEYLGNDSSPLLQKILNTALFALFVDKVIVNGTKRDVRLRFVLADGSEWEV